MATFRTTKNGTGRGTQIRAGVVTAAEVNMAPSAPSSSIGMFDRESPSTAAVCLFVFAVVMLYIIL